MTRRYIPEDRNFKDFNNLCFSLIPNRMIHQGEWYEANM
jgi:hypothetical protein